MTRDLALVLREEQGIFRHFNTYKVLSRDCTAFASPESEEFPHWNMVYPSKPGHAYSRDELRAAESFYSSFKIGGHVLVTGDAWTAGSAETVEYFVSTKKPQTAGAAEIDEFSSAEGTDLDDFCRIAQAAFGISDATRDYFRKKMRILSTSVPSRFWIISFQGKRCGTASVFRTERGADFLFNFGVLPEFQNKQLGASMLQHVVRQAGKTIYTYSDNPIMRDRLLPCSGFASLGTIHTVAFAKYRQLAVREAA